jgi:hypothetical protein
MSALRRIEPLPDVQGRVVPGGIIDLLPIVQWVNPTDLWVDESYQRQISEAGAKLIRDITRAWNWRHFKLPVVVEREGRLVCIDGQHTASGAATREVPLIPVLIVMASALEDQAKAFLGHNTRRVGVTKQQIFHAACTAGDEDALTAKQVCERAGVKILLSPRAEYPARSTMAVSAVTALAKKHGAMKARRLIEALALANLAPIKAVHIRAAELLMFDKGYEPNRMDFEQLTATIVKEREAEFIAGQLAIAQRVPLYKALATHLNKWAARPKKAPLATGMIG